MFTYCLAYLYFLKQSEQTPFPTFAHYYFFTFLDRFLARFLTRFLAGFRKVFGEGFGQAFGRFLKGKQP